VLAAPGLFVDGALAALGVRWAFEMQHYSQRFVSLALWTVLYGCGTAASADGPSSGVDGPAAVAPMSVAIDADTRITLARSACFGSCPVYSLTIAGDGTVAYVGEAFVKVMGPASGQMSLSDVQALADQMLHADYFNLSVPVTCPAGIATDASGATTSLTLGERTHTVQDYHGNACAPAVLGELENAIDALADSQQWVPCDTNGGACCDPVHGNPFLFPCN